MMHETEMYTYPTDMTRSMQVVTSQCMGLQCNSLSSSNTCCINLIPCRQSLL